MGNFKKALEWWPVFIGALALAAGAGALQWRVSAVESRMAATCATASEMDVRLARVEEAVAQLPEIRGDIKELLRRSK
jgi:hypothetical protein